jgi:putative ABC transport system permease protein
LVDLPVRDPDTLVQVSTVTPVQGESYLTFPMFRELSAQQKVFGSLLLAGVGLFGLMSYAVAQRQREIGIRMALGADRRRVVRDVVRDGLTVTLAGLAVGVVAALATVRVIKTLLFGVTPQDPLTLAAAGVSLMVIAILACAVPASRAARVDPIIALRAE